MTKENLYPDMMTQSSIKDEIKKYTRLQETKSILEFLEKENKKYNKLSKRCSKLDILNDIAVGLGTLGLGLSYRCNNFRCWCLHTNKHSNYYWWLFNYSYFNFNFCFS